MKSRKIESVMHYPRHSLNVFTELINNIINNNMNDTFSKVLDNGETFFNNNHQNDNTERDTRHFVEMCLGLSTTTFVWSVSIQLMSIFHPCMKKTIVFYYSYYMNKPRNFYKFRLTYPEIVPLSALIACNGMNSPGGAALSFSHKFHHWLMLYTLAEYIVNMQSSMTSDRFLTILTFRIRTIRSTV